MIVTDATRHSFPQTYPPTPADDIHANHERLEELFQSYPDFHDVANALLTDFQIGECGSGFVDAVFAANNWRWPE